MRASGKAIEAYSSGTPAEIAEIIDGGGIKVIPGAITQAEYEKNAAKHRGKLVIAYCTVGGRSGAYAKQLAGQGVKVKNYEGSILKWVDAGLPLVTLDGQPTKRVHTYSDRYRIPAMYEPVTR